MTLEYKILWIDNDLQSYIENGDVGSIENFLSDRGFEPTIEKVLDDANWDDAFSKHSYYDLIISDYNLESTTGDKIIKEVRDIKKIDTDVLFYSANTNYKDNLEVQKNLAFINRVTFHYGRDTLLIRIESLIELTLKKLLELNAMRGLITAATSNLDVEIEEIVMLLKNKQNKEESELQKIIEKKVMEPLQKKLEKFWDNYDTFQNYFHKIDAVKKWEIFRDLLKPLVKYNPKIAEFLEQNKSYQNEVIDLRNKFAHAKAMERGGKTVLKGQLGSDDFEYDEAACIKIRRSLIAHKNNFSTLKKILSES